MKRISLLILACVGSLNAEISYKTHYTKTGLIVSGIALVGCGLSKLRFCEENKQLVQGICYVLAGAVGGSYYAYFLPENRMRCNSNSFQSTWNSNLFTLVFNTFKFRAFNIEKEQAAITDDLMRKISVYYVDARNPFYNAFEDILSLKKQFTSIVQESRLLLTFYSLDCYKNESYCKVLEYEIELAQKAVELITEALLIIKNTTEYKDAVNLQLHIEK